MKPTIQQLEDRIKVLETELENAQIDNKPDDYLFRWFERANDLVVIIQDGVIKKINPRVKKLLGYEIDEVIDKKFMSYLPVESRQELTERYQRRMKGEKVADYYESVLEHKNGKKVFVGMSAIFFNYKGKPADLIIIHDITELKQSLETLRNSEEKYRSFFKTSKDCVFITSKNGKWLDMSECAPEFFGYGSKEELMKRDIQELYYYPEQRKINIKDIDLKGFSKDVPLSFRKKDGTVIYALVTSLAIKDELGKVFAYQGIIRDITQQKKDEKALKDSKKHLEELNASKDKFFSIISHDLRTPFNAIIGFSELLWKEDFTNAEIREISGDLYRIGKETYDLLNNLLEWSQSETGKIKFAPKLFQVRNIIDSAVTLHSELATRKNITTTVDIPKDFQAFADQNMVMTILRNLVSNAIKFTHKGGRVKIYAEEEPEFIRIDVIDTGIGIPNTYKNKIFDMDKGITTRGTEGESGSGLGLLLCKEFVDKNNGEIHVDSETDKGTTFTVKLPKHM